ncbi:copper-binding protein [Burkholderia alba]|uniref:copper-binding protein n=1 Tax=Burkholderia alba TaxID=2683677 RepID=UPI002B05AE87|nr:copper-binding protein [Burkholderia alba]
MKQAFTLLVAGAAFAFAPHAFATRGAPAAPAAPCCAASETAAHDAASSGMSHGVVRKIDAAAGKLTIQHGPLDNLGMDAMTMSFKVGDPSMLNTVRVGDTIDFVAEDIGGALTVTRLQKP